MLIARTQTLSYSPYDTPTAEYQNGLLPYIFLPHPFKLLFTWFGYA